MTAPHPPLRVVVLYRSALPPNLDAAFRAVSDAPPLHTLARALASTAGWRGDRPAALVARGGPEPVLAAIGRFDADEEARLRLLHGQLARMLPRTVLLDHRGVEDACALLAARLRERYDEAEIASMRFVGVPRGGLIVLGTLAYALDLPRHRIAPWGGDAPAAGPLVVVDDCIISGLRVAEFLDGRDERDVLVATLFSHPDLRAALPGRIERVREVISAHDLHDHAPEEQGDGYDAWRARWQSRSDARGSWIGQPDHVCFPWGEPESSAWNPVSDREEAGWNMIPPELCLKHRGHPPNEALSVQVQEPQGGGGRYRPASSILYGELAGEIVVANLEGGETFALEGVAADMWRELLARPDDASAAAAVACAYDADGAEVLVDVRAFARDLEAAGLIERSHP